MDISIAKKHIETLYLDKCDIIGFDEIREDGITRNVEVVRYTDVPCKISYERLSQTGDGVAPTTALQSKLMISPEIDVKAGSKINITRNGRTTYYECSGEPAIFHNHQEIWLTLLEGYA